MCLIYPKDICNTPGAINHVNIRGCFAPFWQGQHWGQSDSWYPAWLSRDWHSTVALMCLKAPGPQIRRKAKSQHAGCCRGEVSGRGCDWRAQSQGKQNSSLSALSTAGGLLSEQGLGTRGSVPLGLEVFYTAPLGAFPSSSPYSPCT